MKIKKHKLRLKNFLDANKLAQSEVTENRNGKIVCTVQYPIQKHLVLTDLQYIVKPDKVKTNQDRAELNSGNRLAIRYGWQQYRIVFGGI